MTNIEPQKSTQAIPQVSLEYSKSNPRLPKKFRSMTLGCVKLQKSLRNQSETVALRIEQYFQRKRERKRKKGEKETYSST